MCGSSNTPAKPTIEKADTGSFAFRPWATASSAESECKQAAGLASEMTSECGTDSLRRCRSPPSVCRDAAGAPSDLLSSQPMLWASQRGAPSQVSGGAGLSSERLHSTALSSAYSRTSSRRLRASPSLGDAGAGACSDLLWSQRVAWTPQRGRRHCPSEISGAAGLASARLSSPPSSESTLCGHRASPPASYDGAGASSNLLSAQQMPWTSRRGRRRCSSADSISTVSSPRLQIHGGSLTWEYPAAGASRKELSTASWGHRFHTPLKLMENVASPSLHESTTSVPVVSISLTEKQVVLPTLLGGRPSVIDACSKLSDVDECSEAWAPDGTKIVAEIGAFDSELTPTYIVHWLNSVSNGIPSPVLANLKVHIFKHGIDGRMLEDMLDHFRFDMLHSGAEHFTPVHMNRLRKAWYLDHPKPTEVRMHEEQPDVGSESVSTDNTHSPSDLVGSELIAVLLHRLGHWAGFDQQTALVELKDVLSEEVSEEVSIALAHLKTAKVDEVHPDLSPRIAVGGMVERLWADVREDLPQESVSISER